MIEAFTHQCFFYLVLDIFHSDVIMDIQMTEDLRDSTQVSRAVNAVERLYDGIHNLV